MLCVLLTSLVFFSHNFVLRKFEGNAEILAEVAEVLVLMLAKLNFVYVILYMDGLWLKLLGQGLVGSCSVKELQEIGSQLVQSLKNIGARETSTFDGKLAFELLSNGLFGIFIEYLYRHWTLRDMRQSHFLKLASSLGYTH
ncbi:hypothetical protein SLEP1_g3568 [Rubroshorea leprosula]|uniref:Uncharacterized protein n=1 Tax=Rubroshorea leprosula TaxID=152421 RepID=A0AAV5HTF0_9ROSI|nr:hypothetical protein SLEP1_g3568 [Rubroshorea leprosula]